MFVGIGICIYMMQRCIHPESSYNTRRLSSYNTGVITRNNFIKLPNLLNAKL